MEQDAEKIRQLAPDYQLPPRIVPVEALPNNPLLPIGSRPIINMSLRKEKKE